MSYTWIDGVGLEFPLEDDYGVRLLAGASGLDAVPAASSTMDTLGDGSLRVRSRKVASTILLPVVFYDFDVMASLIKSLLSTAVDGAGLGGLRDEDSGRMLTELLYVGGLEGDTSRDAANPLWRRRVIELQALDPYWYGSERTVALPTVSETLFADTATGFATRVPFDGGSPATLTMAGDVAADGVVSLTGPMSRYTFGVLEGAWTLARPLIAAEVVQVDTRIGSRGPRVGVDGATEWGLLNSSSTLHPVPASGAVIVGATSSGGAAASFTYRPRYLTS